VADDVFVGHHRYERAPLPRVVEALLADPRLVRPGRFRAAPAPPPASTPRGEAPITIAGVIETVNHFFDTHPDVPLVADTGDALFASVEIRANECVAPAYYATMGFAIPAALGLQVASGRRPLVLVGDGAFQMTGAEVSHAPAYGCTPVILLLNNCRWEMLQAFFPNARYNDTPAWPFTALAEAWGGRGIVARTGGELRRAIDEAWAGSQFVVIEIPLAAGDISPTLRGFVDAFKARVYRAPAAPPD
jgi:indolepyruvate decarboxylase